MLNSLEDIGGREGFVIAPFAPSAACPIVMLCGQRTTKQHLEHSDSSIPAATSCESDADMLYPFDCFHDAVASGRFHKLVLARKKAVLFHASERHGSIDTLALFHRACELYPRMMIMLFSTPVTGTWLMATPEILLESKSNTVHTIALAGTMPYSEGYAEWSEKNKTEQHVVEQYIEDTIKPFATNIIKDGPYTARAGNLQHLRTDFRFQMSQPLGKIISRLHPTPAVCGLPKAEAQQFIAQNEGMDRRYYSGFAGPINIDGDTHLYVSLRCAELLDSHAVLYAGGGIMPDSQKQQEWLETESKMQTIGNVL